MTKIDNNDVGDSNQRQIHEAERLLQGGIAEAKNIPDAAFQDPVFARRCFDQMVSENEKLLRANVHLTRQLDAYERRLPSPEVQQTLRKPRHQNSGEFRTVSVTLGGVQRNIAVPAGDYADNASALEWWTRMQARYGESSR